LNENTQPLLTAADPVPTSQQADARKSLPRERADRDPRGIFRTPTDASAAPAAGLVRPLCSSSFSLPTVERALAEAGGSSGATLRPLLPRSTAPLDSHDITPQWVEMGGGGGGVTTAADTTITESMYCLHFALFH
jgi:hypothetical protein